MTQPVILHIETATNICSVALSKNDQLLAIRENDEDRSHGSLLTIFVEEVLEEAGLGPDKLDAVAVSKGPGSYTGLRIGVSATKGIAYARDIPVIGMVTLRAMVLAARDHQEVRKLEISHPGLLFCPMIDARRMEVFSAVYNADLEEKQPVEATIVDGESFRELLDDQPVLFFGNGADKTRDTISNSNALFMSGITPSASFMIPLALEAYRKKEFEDTAYFEPYYLKDFVATTPRKKVL